MGGLFSSKAPAPGPYAAQLAADERLKKQEDNAERQEVNEQKKIQARRRSKSSGGQRMLMSQGVAPGDNSPGRQVLSRVLGAGRNPRG